MFGKNKMYHLYSHYQNKTYLVTTALTRENIRRLARAYGGIYPKAVFTIETHIMGRSQFEKFSVPGHLQFARDYLIHDLATTEN